MSFHLFSFWFFMVSKIKSATASDLFKSAFIFSTKSNSEITYY